MLSQQNRERAAALDSEKRVAIRQLNTPPDRQFISITTMTRPGPGQPSPTKVFVWPHGSPDESVATHDFLALNPGEPGLADGEVSSRLAYGVLPLDNPPTMTQFGLRCLKHDDKYVQLIMPGRPMSWCFRCQASEADVLAGVPGTAFKLSDAGLPRVGQVAQGQAGTQYLQVAGSGYMNVVADQVRGHGNKPNQQQPAGAEVSARLTVSWVTAQAIADGDVKASVAASQAGDEDAAAEAEAIDRISKSLSRPAPGQKWVISYALYGANPKYTQGAIRNLELRDLYFPGWTMRYYTDGSIPAAVSIKLRSFPLVEIIDVNTMGGGAVNKGGSAGMFWRFMVMSDPGVERYIIRDSDSRLNARDRFAVEEWITSGKGAHSIRDHPNHRHALGGGLWGAVRGAVPVHVGQQLKSSQGRAYGDDLTFLAKSVWPTVQHNVLMHDAYGCYKWAGSRPFPTKRRHDYQHVGQVFDAGDKPRMGDIDNYIRGRPVPQQCRLRDDWLYG